MSITVLLEADVKAGQKQHLLDLLTKHLPETRQYSGFISISIHSEVDKNKVIFFSKWNTLADFQSYLEWRAETGVMDRLVALLSSAPLIRYFNTEIGNERELINGQ